MIKILFFKNGLFKWSEKHKRKGIFQIWEIDRYTKKKKQIDEFNNLLTSDSLDREIQIYEGIDPDMHVKYLAVGDDNTAVAAGDAALGNEIERVFYVDQTKTDTGELTTDFYLAFSVANFEIEELGIFAGVGATATADSGNMLSHVLWNYTKTAAVEVLIRRIDTVS